jgi:hypothetical protein
MDENQKEWQAAIDANPQIEPFADTAKAFADSVIAAAQGGLPPGLPPHPHWGGPPNGANAAPPMTK